MTPTSIREVLSDLPDHRGLTLINIRDRIKEKYFDSNDEPKIFSKGCFELSTLIEHFITRYKLDVPFSKINGDETWEIQIRHLISMINDFEPKVMAHILEKEIDNVLKEQDTKIAQETQFGETVLSLDEKISIHKNLENVRELVEQSNIPDSKKNALLKRINELSAEVDRYGTKTDSFLGFILELSIAAKKFHTNLKPAIDDVQQALQTIYIRKSRDEGVALPKPEEMPQLPKPEDVGNV